MSSGYSPNIWLSNDTQSMDSNSLTDNQRKFLLERKPENRRELHIRKKLLFRVEKYSQYRHTFPTYTQEQLKEMLDKSFETSIQYEDIYPMRRVSTNINTSPQLGVVDLPNIEMDKLFVYDPKISMCRKAQPFQAELFSSILKSESNKIDIKEYTVSKQVWNSIPLFIVSVKEGDTMNKYYMFYHPLHNNSLLSTPLFYLQQDSDLYVMYNSRGLLISKLSTDLF